MSEKSSEREMIYLHDENGLIAGLRLIEDGIETTYYYQTNIQGDVIGILNEAGVQVAAYSYDEWGKVLSITGSDAERIGQLNPIRYRGYYYDWETGFYYLNSRYYDPEVGRFISPDTSEILKAYPMLLRDKNLFAYCDCNPIVREDVYGMFWETVFDIASLCISVADVCSDPTDPWAWAGLGGDAVDVLVPFLAGVGEGIKSAKLVYKVDEVADATKAINKSGKLQDPGFDYTPKVQGQMNDAKDLNHSFPTIVDATVDLSKAQPIVGADGIVRQIIKVPGSINDRMGMYEYIIEVDGKINHRFFKAIE